MSQGAHSSRLASILALVAALLTLASTSSGTAIGAFKGSNGKLAFVRAGDIWVIAADGSAPTRLTTNPASDRSPRFSPDGSQIAFSSNRDGDFEIYVMPALGGDVAQQLTFNEGEQDPLPLVDDGRHPNHLRQELFFGLLSPGRRQRRRT